MSHALYPRSLYAIATRVGEGHLSRLERIAFGNHNAVFAGSRMRDANIGSRAGVKSAVEYHVCPGVVPRFCYLGVYLGVGGKSVANSLESLPSSLSEFRFTIFWERLTFSRL